MSRGPALSELLGITRGVTSIIGSGGKSALIHRLTEELRGTIIVTTTGFIYPVPGAAVFGRSNMDERQEATTLRLMLLQNRVVTVGTPMANGKLGRPKLPFSLFKELADYVLIEADTPDDMPLRVHEANEPDIPEESGRVIAVFGASGFDRRVVDVIRNPRLFTLLTGADEETASARPDLVAKAFKNERLTPHAFINQVETKESYDQAKLFAAAYPEADVSAGSLRYGVYVRL